MLRIISIKLTHWFRAERVNSGWSLDLDKDQWKPQRGLLQCVCVCVFGESDVYNWLWIFTGQEGRRWSEGGEEGRKQDEDRKPGAGQDRVGLRANPLRIETNGCDRKENMQTGAGGFAEHASFVFFSCSDTLHWSTQSVCVCVDPLLIHF